MKKLSLLFIILLITGCGSSSVELDINSEKVQSLHFSWHFLISQTNQYPTRLKHSEHSFSEYSHHQND